VLCVAGVAIMAKLFPELARYRAGGTSSLPTAT
jgi:hypothetical protein